MSEVTAPPDEANDVDVDELPEDLDVSAFVGPYQFPNIKRRRISAAIFAVVGGAMLAAFATAGDAVLINKGFLIGGLVMLALAAYHVLTGWDLQVTEKDALVSASRSIGIAVGHASAQLGWRGLRSRPTWRILCYSADTPPTKRGFVLVDGIDGTVIDKIIEDNPEDWADFDE